MSEMDEAEPKRWKDDQDAPARVRDVLRAGGAVPKMPDAVRAAVLAGLPVSPAPAPAPAPGPGTGAAVSAGKAAGLSPLAIGAGAVAAAVVVASMVWLVRGGTPREPAPVPSSRSVAPSVVATAAPTTPEVLTVTPTPSATEHAPLAEPSAASPPRVASSSLRPPASNVVPAASSASSASPASPASSATRDDLAEESAIIGRARGTLASNPSATLAAVDEHARRFPRGELGSEREYLRISALRRAGRVDEAKTYARSYLAKYPSSPQAPAVKTFLAEAP